jgi:hypothetical protein
VTAFPITTAAPRGMAGLAQNTDLSQIATRILSRGGGSNALSDISIGAATIPIGEASWYGASGTVEVGQQQVTYSGVAAGGTGSSTGYLAPPAAISIVGGSGGSLTAGATYIVAGTYVTAEGETSSGVTSSVTLGGAQNEILYSSFAVPADPKVTLKRIYISDANAGIATLKKFTDVAIATTSGVIAGTGTGAIPTTNAAGFGAIATAAGSTSLPVEDCAQFLSGGGWAEAPGGQVFSYTGRSVSSGPGSLTGIPASGPGSLTAAVRAGTVSALAHLTGCAGIVYAINSGDPVNILVIINDAAAQAALAALVGGDGIHEMFISDGTLVDHGSDRARECRTVAPEGSARHGQLHQSRSVDAERARCDAHDYVSIDQRHVQDSARHDHRTRVGRADWIHLPAATSRGVEPSLLI